MAKRGRSSQPVHSVQIALLLVSALAFALSLATVLRAYAMPVEARTTEPWYSYQSSVGFDYTANVVKGRYYADAVLQPDQMLQTKNGVEPPVYHRVLISQLTDSVQVNIPYSFRGDRPAPIKAKLWIDGQLVLPGMWQKPYPFVQDKEITVPGPEFSGTETFVIPIKQLLGDLENVRNDLKITVEPMEIHIHPVMEVEVSGLKQVVNVSNAPEFMLALRPTTLELDDIKQSKVDKVLAETKVVPIVVRFLGADIRVSVLRQISITTLFVFVGLGAIMLFLRRRKPDARTILQKLGPNLLTVRAFELPGDTAVAEVRSAKELIQLQVQTERPVIKVGNTYYLLDGTTCYRFINTPDEQQTTTDD